ncbi:ABC transporter ATP-binding protein [Marinomonas agarivorans]|nr:ABC transporter ATP-binding protein [Marinomonas agarivorans]
MLNIKDLTLKIGDLSLADKLSVQMEAGKIHVIIGPNGTGKSSFLRTLFAELTPQAGSIEFQGQSIQTMGVNAWRKQFGYMPQDIQLDVSLTVLEVVLLGQLDQLGLHITEEHLQRALRALDQVGLLPLFERDISTLSGGQCQMALFAQVLMRQPDILLLDEPASALDLYYQHKMFDCLIEDTKKNNRVTIMVLHDLNLAAQYADQLIILNQGNIDAAGSPTEVLTAERIERVYQVNVDVSHDEDGCPFVRSSPFIRTSGNKTPTAEQIKPVSASSKTTAAF